MAETSTVQPTDDSQLGGNPRLKKFSLLFLILIILFGVSALGVQFFLRSTRTQNKNNVINAPLEEIHIANIGEFSIFNIIAREKGYFKENGLNAVITEYDAGPASMKTLLDGKADIAVAGDFVGVNNIFKNHNIRIISEASSQKAFNIVARVDKGIKQPKDLKGKKIGVTKKSSGEFYLNRFLTLNDLTPNDILTEDLIPASMAARLENGQLDAVVIFDPHAYNLKEKMGDNIVMWSAQGDQYTYALIYSTKDYINTHSEVINHYLKALTQAEQFTQTHTLETQQLLSSALKYDAKYIKHIWSNFNFKIGLEQKLLLTLEDQSSFAINNKLTSETQQPNYLDYIYFKGLNTVKPSSITIIH